MATHWNERTIEDIAQCFVSARRSATPLSNYPGTMPPDIPTAYAIQDRAIAAYDEPVAGWKVGRVPLEYVERSGALRLAGPIFASQIFEERDARIEMPIFDGGFGAAEAEFLLRLGATAPSGKTQYDMAEAAALVGSVHVGIEIASSPFPGINDHGPAVTISDFGNNYGLIVGAEIANWRGSGFEDWNVETEIDGQSVGRATVSQMLDGALGSVRFLLELLGQRGIPAPAGLWISTGAVTGVHPVRVGQQVLARFGDNHRLECSIGSAK